MARVRRRIVVVGDALLDRDVDGVAERLAPDAPVPVLEERRTLTRPGGAGLAAVLAAADGHDVTLVTSVGDDAAGAELLLALERCGVAVVNLGNTGPTPEKIRMLAAGRPLMRLDRGARGGAVGSAGANVERALGSADAILVADYGCGVCTHDELRALLVAAAARGPVVWDPHPRGARPIDGVTLVTPNRVEAALFAGDGGQADDVSRAPHWCRALLDTWRASAVAVKLGARGAVVLEQGGRPLFVPSPSVAHADPCGAGDRFAASATALLASGASVHVAVERAVAEATAFVAAGGAARVGRLAVPSPNGPARATGSAANGAEPVDELIARVRARGGTVVATGGCFDVIHAGHVRMLEAARALGDCLVVLLNSDASVKRLKGPARPIHPVEDRRAVLLALQAVDAAVVFDEDTPQRALERLAPDVWVKAADYAHRAMPESEALAAAGAETVLVPWLEGRSTTRIVDSGALTLLDPNEPSEPSELHDTPEAPDDAHRT